MSFLFSWVSSISNSIPSDKNQQQQQQQPPSPSPPSAPTPAPVPVPISQQQPSQPERISLLPNNLKLIYGGLAFFYLSSLITRRALHRRHLSTIPPFYTSSVYHRPPVSGAQDAFEALNLATLNVTSVAMIGAGATMYALNVNTVDDLRRMARTGSYGVTGNGTTAADEELEEAVEDFVVSLVGKRDELKDLKEKLRKEREEKRKEKEKKGVGNNGRAQER